MTEEGSSAAAAAAAGGGCSCRCINESWGRPLQHSTGCATATRRGKPQCGNRHEREEDVRPLVSLGTEAAGACAPASCCRCCFPLVEPTSPPSDPFRPFRRATPAEIRLKIIKLGPHRTQYDPQEQKITNTLRVKRNGKNRRWARETEQQLCVVFRLFLPFF